MSPVDKKETIITLGTLNSFYSLNQNIGPSIQQLYLNREKGKLEQPIWDIRDLQAKRINVFALTSFLAIAYSLSQYFKHPLRLLLKWDPYVLRFLYDIDFFKISEQLHILTWDPKFVGGLARERFAESNKLNYFLPEGIDSINKNSEKELNDFKEGQRELISFKTASQFGDIFSNNKFIDYWNNELEFSLSHIIPELAVNSMIHGESVPFIGIQRTRKGISISVCDSGIGLLKSMQKNGKISIGTPVSHIEAIVIACLLRKETIGIRKVIETVLLSHGYVRIATHNAEIQWNYRTWNEAKDLIDINDYIMLGSEISEIFTQSDLYEDEVPRTYLKIYQYPIRGSRITFEIPF